MADLLVDKVFLRPESSAADSLPQLSGNNCSFYLFVVGRRKGSEAKLLATLASKKKGLMKISKNGYEY